MSAGTATTLLSAAPNESSCPSLSFKTRLIGFAICTGVGNIPYYALGIVLQVISWIMVGTGKFTAFALCTTTGILLMIGSYNNNKRLVQSF